ncbi:MAG: hypothetical protein HYR94_11025, partial [Chloroflexi bacterium]|nr:hypothetical protein [Chloroflexota bacterium]
MVSLHQDRFRPLSTPLGLLTALLMTVAACGGGQAEVVEKEVIKTVEVVETIEVEVVPTVEVEKIVEGTVPAETGAEVSAETMPAEFHEAPALAKVAEKGELPPVEERLPKNPRVLPGWEEIGQYGGNWRRAYNGISDRWGPTKL